MSYHTALRPNSADLRLRAGSPTIALDQNKDLWRDGDWSYEHIVAVSPVTSIFLRAIPMQYRAKRERPACGRSSGASTKITTGGTVY